MKFSASGETEEGSVETQLSRDSQADGASMTHRLRVVTMMWTLAFFWLGGHGIRPELIAFDQHVENRQQLSHRCNQG